MLLKNATGKSLPREKKPKGVLFPTITMSGPEQMATDVILLNKAIKDSNISFALRFYNWNGFWISIGKNQKEIPKSWLELVSERKINLVRRPSGGTAVLHGAGLTYSLVWISPPRQKLEAYYLASKWLIKGLSDLGLSLQFGTESTNPYDKNCFATATSADLIDAEGQKRIGSAQLWRKGHLLQHGEILLDPPSKLWMEIFDTKAPKPASSCIPRDNLDKILYETCCNYWSGFDWEAGEIEQKEFEQISKDAGKYFFRK